MTFDYPYLFAYPPLRAARPLTTAEQKSSSAAHSVARLTIRYSFYLCSDSVFFFFIVWNEQVRPLRGKSTSSSPWYRVTASKGRTWLPRFTVIRVTQLCVSLSVNSMATFLERVVDKYDGSLRIRDRFKSLVPRYKNIVGDGGIF